MKYTGGKLSVVFCTVQLGNDRRNLARDVCLKGEEMPITVEVVPSRRKKIAVTMVPAQWQIYIEV